MNVTFAKRMDNLSGNLIREILKLTAQPDIISFAGGMPSPGSFPIAELKEAAMEAFDQAGAQVLQYGETEGYKPLKKWVSGWLTNKGIAANEENLLILSGSQQGLDLAAKAFLDPGDQVVIESPSYLAAFQIFDSYQATYLTVGSDEHGMKVDELEEILANNKPKFIYTVATFQNPTGATLALERRQKLAELSAKYNVPVIEDDPYGWLRYEGEEIPTIKALDKAGTVIYLGSASKIISPGIRVGWAVADPTILRKMIIGKQAGDVHTSNLSQAIVHNYCSKGLLDPHIAKTCEEYKVKRDAMLDAMKRYFPAEAHWNPPMGGLFIWVTMPEGINTKELLEAAVKEKVAFIPGYPFFVGKGGENTMRLNFSNASLEAIEEGIKRLGEAIKKFLKSH